jgi:hypothetical protein
MREQGHTARHRLPTIDLDQFESALLSEAAHFPWVFRLPL